jgi:hypothetical protein
MRERFDHEDDQHEQRPEQDHTVHPLRRLGEQAAEIEPPRHPEPACAGQGNRDPNLLYRSNFDLSGLAEAVIVQETAQAIERRFAATLSWKLSLGDPEKLAHAEGRTPTRGEAAQRSMRTSGRARTSPEQRRR